MGNTKSIEHWGCVQLPCILIAPLWETHLADGYFGSMTMRYARYLVFIFVEHLSWHIVFMKYHGIYTLYILLDMLKTQLSPIFPLLRLTDSFYAYNTVLIKNEWGLNLYITSVYSVWILEAKRHYTNLILELFNLFVSPAHTTMLCLDQWHRHQFAKRAWGVKYYL